MPKSQAKPNGSFLPGTLIQALPEALRVHSALGVLEDGIATLQKDLKKSQKGGAIALARAFVVLRKLKDEVEETVKKFNAVFDEHKDVLVPQAFEHEGVTSVPLAEGFRVGVSSQTRASVRKDMREAAHAWLRANGFESLIVGTVNASTLSATAKSLLEDSNKELPPDLFNVALMATTSVTATK